MSRPATTHSAKICRQSAVGDPHSRSVVIERPRDRDWNAMLSGKDIAQGFAEALRLVVACPRSDAGNVTTIAFVRRNGGGVRVPVNFAAGKKQKSIQGRRSNGSNFAPS